jgi:Tfp pilus assembly protein PilO
LREATVFRSANNANQHSDANFFQGSWTALVRIIVLEILVLLALAVALVYYLNWSSEISVSEFMAAEQAPLHAAKDHASCDRSG